MVRFTGRIWDFYRDKEGAVEEGDVFLQAKLDNAGRAAVAGRHANQGYSGWFAGFIHAEGGRRRFLSWPIMFPDQQNGYNLQSQKADAIFRIEECLKTVGDMEILKAKGGWRFADEADLELRIDRHWSAWNAPTPGMTREKAQAIAEGLNKMGLTKVRYTADQILARPESDFEKRMRLRDTRRLGITGIEH